MRRASVRGLSLGALVLVSLADGCGAGSSRAPLRAAPPAHSARSRGAGTSAVAPSPARAVERTPLRYALGDRTLPSPLVHGSVDGHPAIFLLDSGASRHILAASFAREIGLATVATANAVRGHGEATSPLAEAPHAQLLIDGLAPLVSAPLAVVELPAPLAQLGVAGFLAPQSLASAGRAVVLALTAGELRTVDRDALEPGGGDGIVPTHPAIARCAPASSPSTGGLFVVRAEIDAQPLDLLVDTGARSTVVYAGSRAGQVLAPRASPTALTAQTVSGTLSVAMLRAARVQIARFGVPADVAILPGAARTPLPGCSFDGVLGMDVLRRCDLVYAPTALTLRCR